jgi:hypothetical protein
VPLFTPLTTPVAPILATNGLLLLQIPPGVTSLNVIKEPVQIVVGPVIAATVGTTVTVTGNVADALPQPVVAVYETVAEPAATPVITPVDETVKMVLLLLLHKPPLADSVRVDVEPVQRAPEPVIAPALGAGLTEIFVIALDVPQLFVTL